MIKLRPFQQSDIRPLLTYMNDPDIVRYLSSVIPFPYLEKHAQWWIDTGSQEGVTKAIEIDGKLVGCIGVTLGEFEYSRNGEIGYWLAKKYWGQSIIKQAINEIIPLVFDTTEITRIYASVFAENEASKKVLIKSGFELEAIHKQAVYKNEQFYDDYIFSLLKAESKNSL